VQNAAITRESHHPRGLRAITANFPNAAEAALVIGSGLLTLLSFPNFDLWFLAWISLSPLFIVVARAEKAGQAFVAGWLWGTIFFYGTCWWLAFPMVRYAHLGAWLVYPLLLLPIAFVALFPALACAFAALLVRRFGATALLLAPFVWVAADWLRYVVTGQLWNALGYSQAFHPWLIGTARWGGVYGVTFILLAFNAAITLTLIGRRVQLALLSLAVLLVAAVVVASADLQATSDSSGSKTEAAIIAVQPNVPMDLAGDPAQMDFLVDRHFSLTRGGLQLTSTHQISPQIPHLVIWPESPMNFSYARDPHLRKVIGDFARSEQTSVLFNSLEPAKNGGDQNSAILVNEKGEMSARYDKIRLMPFGEYVPLPHWLPGASSVRGLVGEFEPGNSYTLMPLGALRAGVFICIEAAHPSIARNFTNAGADVLINISNDGYLGPTAVMRQHLANAVLRAVENDRDLLRVTNSGITAYIRADGRVSDETTGFHEDVRTWTISKGEQGTTFYSRHGDVFVYCCALVSLGFISASFMRRRVW